MTSLIPKRLLVLDLDETLVHTNGNEVSCRPGLDEFLKYIFSEFDVAVWTASEESYAKQVLDIIMTPEQIGYLVFIKTRKNCTIKNPSSMFPYYIKKMKKVRRYGYTVYNTLVIDDSEQAWANSYGNLINIPEYYGRNDDTALKTLIEYLEQIKDLTNYRSINHRQIKWS